jgi:lipoate-protein ligase A
MSLGTGPVALHAKEAGDCAAPLSAAMKATRFSACFQEPVCNDVMMAGRKVIGGALRLTREAVLYQGSIQLDGTAGSEKLKEAVVNALEMSF